jgi:hypothetical protein
MTHGLTGGWNGGNGHAPAPLSPSADGPPSAAAPGDKDAATGRFLPGNKLGRGNPHYRRLAANRTAFLEAVGPEQVRQLAGRLLAQALAGDVDAARLVLAYGLGRPPAAVDPDGADRDAWQRLQGAPVLADVLVVASGRDFAGAVEAALGLREESDPKPIRLPGGAPDGPGPAGP